MRLKSIADRFQILEFTFHLKDYYEAAKIKSIHQSFQRAVLMFKNSFQRHPSSGPPISRKKTQMIGKLMIFGP